MQRIEPLLIRKSPNQLRTLKLVKLTSGSAFINELLTLLTTCASSLNSLSLVQLRLSTANVQKLIEFLESSGILEQLDISWNNFIPNDFIPITESLQNNTLLRALNLSWNLMTISGEQKARSKFMYPVRKDLFFSRDPWDLSHTELMADRFSKMIRFSAQL